MRVFAAAVLAALCLATMAGCSQTKQPPPGRWVGSYDTDDTMIVARLEIAPNGTIFLSAPDALNIGAVSADQRAAMRDRLAAGLASSWGDVEPRQMDFDGHVFRKPGGIAPQMEWNPDTKRMTLIVYLGMNTVRIPMRAVADFPGDPWSG